MDSFTPSRRKFLGTLAAASVIGAAPPLLRGASSGSEKTPPAAPKTRNPFVYRFGIGEIEAWSISDGHMVFREGLNLMWPDNERDAMRADLVQHGERTDG